MYKMQVEKDLEGFKGFLEDKHNLSYHSVKNYTSQMHKFFNKNKEYNDNSLFNFLRKKSNTVRCAAVSHYLNFLEEEKEKDVEGLRDKIKNKIKTKSYEREEFQTLQYKEVVKLIDKLKKIDKNLAALLMVMFDTGARARAVMRLRGRDIEVYDDEIIVNLQEKTKSGVRRVITKDTYNYLKKYFKNKLSSDKKFLFIDTKRLSDKKLDEVYYDYWSKLKSLSKKVLNWKVGVSFHWVRRGAGLKLYEDTGNDIVAVSEFYGHDDVGTTKKYLKIQAQKAKDEVQKAKRDW